MYKYIFFIFMLVYGCSPKKENQQPNVILILADDLGYSDISGYRNRIVNPSEKPSTAQTPFIDQLAREGMQFTQFYCGAAVCSPSRSALITGRNATRVGIYNWIPENGPMHLRNEEITIAEMLGKDYQTGHFGKWHLTSMGMDQPLPNDQGFDYSFFTYNNANPSHHNPVNFHRNGEAVGDLEGYACQLVVDEAISWLSRREEKRPFYINVWFNEPHEKVAAPDSMASRHAYRNQYYGAIENMDNAIGRLMAFLESEGLDEETILIFTSDNGSQVVGSNDPLRGQKAFNFEGGIRVPFVIKWDGKVPSGTVSDVPGSFTDILPSIARLTGTQLPVDRKLDGEDISKVFLGEEPSFSRDSPLFFYRYFHDPVCMLREGDWVLLGYEKVIPFQMNYDAKEMANLKPEPGEPAWSMWGFQESHMEYINKQELTHFELYDISNDPAQQIDLSSEHPGVVDQMRVKMLELKEEMVREGGNWF